MLARLIVRGALLCLALAGSARAQEIDDSTRSAARALATEGSGFYEANDFEQAYDRFNRAYQLVHVPTVGIWSARSLVKIGRWVEASERYLEIERSELSATAPPEHAKAKEEAAAERKLLEPRIPSVRIAVEGAEATEVFVTLNGQLVPSPLLGVKRSVNPGKQYVKGVRGEKVVEASFELLEAQFREVELVFPKAQAAAAPAPASSTSAPGPQATLAADSTSSGFLSDQRNLAYLALGVGGAALVTGGVFGLLALGQESTLDKDCPNNKCEPAFHDDVDSYGVKKTVASIGILGGLALGATGAVLLLTAPDAPKQQARFGAYFTATQAGVLGAF